MLVWTFDSIADIFTKSLVLNVSPPEVLRRMVKEGKAGKKNRRGFYEWNQEKHCQWSVASN